MPSTNSAFNTASKPSVGFLVSTEGTYYKHFSSRTAPRIQENQHIASLILHIYADYGKRLGAYKITYVLARDYGIRISIGRVYRLMKTLQLPQMSISRSSSNRKHNDNGECSNHLNRDFSQKVPNLVWDNDITYLRAGDKWYYLCIVMNLFSRKVISWQFSAKPDADLVMAAFLRAYEKRNAPYGLMFHSDRGIPVHCFFVQTVTGFP